MIVARTSLPCPTHRASAIAFAHWTIAFAASLCVHAVVLWLLLQGPHGVAHDAASVIEITLLGTQHGQSDHTDATSDTQLSDGVEGDLVTDNVAPPEPLHLPLATHRVAVFDHALAVADLPQASRHMRELFPATAFETEPSIAGTSIDRPRLEWQIADWLERHRTYPRAARRAGYEGTAWVRFTLDRRGRLQHSELVDSSGHGLLDRAALELLDRASPFPALPPASDFDEIELLLPIEYRLMAAVDG